MNNVILFTKTSLVLALWLSYQPLAFAGDCGGYLKAVNLWEDEINGQIVSKYTVFGLGDWDPNAEYDGILLTENSAKTIKTPILVMEFVSKSKVKKRFETFKNVKSLEENAALKIFSDLEPKDFFSFKEAGTYTVRLKDGETVVCSESHAYNLGH